MNGKELYQRVADTVQEMHLKIGDSEGSVSLYYPFNGDISKISEEFRGCCASLPKEIAIETVSGRIRVIVPEAVCRYISSLPVRSTLKDVVELVNSRCSIDDFRRKIYQRHPDASFTEADGIEFDWVLTFSQDTDPDVYCISVEMGTVTYHRFSKEDYLAMDFVL